VFSHGGGGIGQLEDYFGNSHLDATYYHNGKFAASLTMTFEDGKTSK
jgi:hypothetical protein